jgi:hypothetical protein
LLIFKLHYASSIAQVLQREQIISNAYNSEAVDALALSLKSIDADIVNQAQVHLENQRCAVQQELQPNARDNSSAACSYEEETIDNDASTPLFSLADIEAFTAAALAENATSTKCITASEDNMGHDHSTESAVTWTRCTHWNPCAIGLAQGQSTVSLAL